MTGNAIRLAMVVATVGIVAGGGLAAPGALGPRTPEQRARMLAARGKQLAALGGVVEKPMSGNVIRFVNAQARVAAEEVSRTAGNIARSLMTWHETDRVAKTDKTPAALAEESLAKPGTGVAIVVADDGGLPSLLVAPEEGWCVVNVAKLADDLPPQEVLVKRLRKEMWRASAMVLGGTNAQMTPCAMTDIHKPADLDSVSIDAVCPEVVMKMMASMATRNINPRQRTTYDRACREGWAPAPTNDVQKAIWEKVKADKERGPTNPITIPPPKK